MFDWDRDNLKKIKAHGLDAAAVEEALSISPILIYEQEADGESRYVYYGETAGLRLLAVVLTERDGKIRVITAYELDAGQKRDYFCGTRAQRTRFGTAGWASSSPARAVPARPVRLERRLKGE
ncbi:MAG: BrnT family toxin [Acidobacteria bacterium]|nr:BrnT family toxin [Acidobacteriota bacterium]